MLSSISSYFTPNQTQMTPIDQAVKDRLYLDPVKMEKAGISPTEKDSQGLTLVDHAIFSGQSDAVFQMIPHPLTKQPSKSHLAGAKPCQSVLLYTTSKEALPVKKTIEAIKGEDLDNPNSKDAQALRAFLDAPMAVGRSFSLSARYGMSKVHLLAAFGNAKVMEYVVKNYPEKVNVLDKNGNNPAHYASLNSDEGVFVALAKGGADIFSRNNKFETPIKSFVATIYQKDPLRLENGDIYLFMSDWLPTALAFAYKQGLLSDESYEIGQGLAAGIDILAWLSNIGFSNASLPNKASRFLYSFATIGLLLAEKRIGLPIPLLSLPLKAISAYALGQRAIASLKQAYEYGTNRPLKALAQATVKSSNAYTSMGRLYKECISSYYTLLFARKAPEFAQTVEENCGEFQEPTIEANCFEEVIDPETNEFVPKYKTILDGHDVKKPLCYGFTAENEKFQPYVRCSLEQFEKVYSKDLERDPWIEHAYRNVGKPFMQDIGSNLPEQMVYDGGEYGGHSISLVSRLADHYFTEYMNVDAPHQTSSDEACDGYHSTQEVRDLANLERLQKIGSPVTGTASGPKGCIQKALDILGVRDVCDKKVNKQYKKIAREVHPDRLKGRGGDDGSAFTNLGLAKELVDNERENKGC